MVSTAVVWFVHEVTSSTGEVSPAGLIPRKRRLGFSHRGVCPPVVGLHHLLAVSSTAGPLSLSTVGALAYENGAGGAKLCTQERGKRRHSG